MDKLKNLLSDVGTELNKSSSGAGTREISRPSVYRSAWSKPLKIDQPGFSEILKLKRIPDSGSTAETDAALDPTSPAGSRPNRPRVFNGGVWHYEGFQATDADQKLSIPEAYRVRFS